MRGEAHPSPPRPQLSTLLLRLLVAYLLPTLILIGLFGWLAVRETERALEESLGRRLIGIAQAAATQLRAEAVTFLVPGDDDSRTARRLRHKLRVLRDRTTGVARILILDRRLRSRMDTHAGVRIGDRYYNAEADRLELERVFSGGEASSVLFTGADGRFYKTGYAAVRDEGGKVVAAVGVEGGAEFFVTLQRLSTYLLLSGAVIAALVVLISVLVARRITGPLRALAREATRIGAGDLERPIAVRGRDEVGLLAGTLNEMRQALFERDQELQLMLSGIAHEVRNPLGGIALFAGLLREEVADNPEQLEMVERIERELTYLKNVVGEFLDFARHSPPRLQPLALGALLEDVAQLLAADAAKARVTIRVEAAASPEALGDAEQLRRVLVNLARNALQATDPGGEVWLRSGQAASNGAPYLEVSDTGRGIPEEIRDKVFAPFFTTREKGTGLGLALSQKIAAAHNGEMVLDSGASGTRIRVILPPCAAKQAARGDDAGGQDPDRGP